MPQVSCIKDCMLHSDNQTAKPLETTYCSLCAKCYHDHCVGLDDIENAVTWFCPSCRQIVPNVQKTVDSVVSLSQSLVLLTEEVKSLRVIVERGDEQRQSVEQERDNLRHLLEVAEQRRQAADDERTALRQQLDEAEHKLQTCSPRIAALTSSCQPTPVVTSETAPLVATAPPVTPTADIQNRPVEMQTQTEPLQPATPLRLRAERDSVHEAVAAEAVVSMASSQASLSHSFWAHSHNKAGTTYADVCRNTDHVTTSTRWFNGADDPLSNLFDCTIYAQGRYFSGSESLFQWRKARVMRQHQAAKDILKAKNAYVAMKIGVSIECDWKWFNNMFQIMLDCARVKAEQCKEFRDALLQTGDRHISENTDNPIWGGRAHHQCDQMGRILEQVREELRSGKIAPAENETPEMNHPPPPNPAFSTRTRPPAIPEQYRKRAFPAHQYKGPTHSLPYNQSRDTRRCYNCNETGHLARDCGHEKVIRCDVCQGYGHKANTCPSALTHQQNTVPTMPPMPPFQYGIPFNKYPGY